jgi:hypothetical protein
MTNSFSNAATAATSTVVSTTATTSASTEVKDLLVEGQKKTAEFVLVLSGISLMCETVTLKGVTDESKFTGDIKDDVAGSRVKVTTKASLFSEPIALLKGIKKKAEAVLNKYGIKAGIDGGFFIPKDAVVACLEDLIPLRDEFNDELKEMEKNFNDYVSAEQARCNQIEDIELRKEALGKIPTFEKFASKCGFKPIVLDWAQTSDTAVNAFLSESKTEKATSIVEDYFNKIFDPFAIVKYDYDNNLRNKGAAYKADEVGKKRSSIRKACQKALDTKFCMELVFKDEPEKSLLEKAYNVIEVVNQRFAGAAQMAKPSAGLTKVMIDVYKNILAALCSREAFEDFLSKGGDVETILGGFDIAQAKRGVIETELDFSSKEEKMASIDNAIAELEALCEQSSGKQQVQTQKQEAIPEVGSVEVTSTEENTVTTVHNSVELDPVASTEETEIATAEVVEKVPNVKETVQEEKSSTEEAEILADPVSVEETAEPVEEVILPVEEPVSEPEVTEEVKASEEPTITIDPSSMDVEDFYKSLGL